MLLRILYFDLVVNAPLQTLLHFFVLGDFGGRKRVVPPGLLMSNQKTLANRSQCIVSLPASLLNLRQQSVMSTEQLDFSEPVELLLLTISECYVYKVPPLRTASGHRYLKIR